MIASKEKALCDMLATVKEIETEKDVVEYLETDLRIDWDEIKDLDVVELRSIRDHYRSKPVSLFIDWYLSNMLESKGSRNG